METWGRRVKIDPFKSLHDVCGPKVPAPHSFSKESNISICGWLVVLNLRLTSRRVALAASEEARQERCFLPWFPGPAKEGRERNEQRRLYLGQGVSKTVKVSRLQCIKANTEKITTFIIYVQCHLPFTWEKLLLDLSVWSPQFESLT